jgi:uncharacterized protein (TIGR03437 family)
MSFRKHLLPHRKGHSAFFLLVFLLTASDLLHSQPASYVMGPVAGSGVNGFSGDGGPATSAALNNPIGVTVDAAGNLYIADSANQRIRRVTASGIITTVAGNGTADFSGDGGPATSAAFNGPAGIVVDAAGNLYITDDYNNRVRRVTPDGIITTVAGNGTRGYSGDHGAATSAALNDPYGIAVDAAGNVYIADRGNYRIRCVTPWRGGGIITTVAGNGAHGFSGDGGPATSAAMNGPVGIAVDAAGNLYIADLDNNRIRRVTPSGIITTVAGNGTAGFSGDGGSATSAALNGPVGIAVDTAGNLYIADRGNYRIRRVTPSGIITTVAGNGTRGFSGNGGPATSATIIPHFVAVDGVGNVVFSSSYNPSGGDQVRKLVPTQPVVSAWPAALTFNYRVGEGNPQGQTVLVSSAPILSFSIVPSGNWLTLSAHSGVTPANITVTVNPATMPVGVYSGTLTITLLGAINSPLLVPVSLVVSDPRYLNASTSTIAFEYQMGGAMPAERTVSLSNSGPPLPFVVITSGGTWFSASPASGTTPANVKIRVDPLGLLAGIYRGTLVVASSTASNTLQELEIGLTVIPPVPPSFSSAGIVNAASYAPGLVPGSIVTLFGTNLSVLSGTVLAGGKTALSGTSVLVANVPAPLISIMHQSGQEQISFQVPFELEGARTASVAVLNNGSRTEVWDVPVYGAQPGIFEVPINQQGTRSAAVVHLNGQLVAPSNPAKRGEIVMLFFTGGGPLRPSVATGVPGPVPPPEMVLPVVVGVADAGCEVLFAGYAPRAVGLYQVNFRVPEDSPVGPSVKLNMRVGETFGQSSAIAVQ